MFKVKDYILVGYVQGEGLHIGWSYCRNVSLSRKVGCISKSYGIEKFSASATGSTDSVRGIGIKDKYATSNDYENSTIKKVAANADDGLDDGTTYTNTDSYTAIGKNVSEVIFDAIFRFDGWTIAQSTQIISATLRLWSNSYNGGGAAPRIIKTRIYADDQSDPGQISNHADYVGRTLSTAYKDHTINVPESDVGDWEITIDVTDVIQELINSYAYTNEAIQLFCTDNGSGIQHTVIIRTYDVGNANLYANLEVVVDANIPQSPSYYIFVKGATVGELWKLNENKVPSEVTQSGESYAFSYQSQTGHFLQFGNDLLFTDDGYNDAIQQWDISDNPSEFEDVVANYNGRRLAEFRSRVWFIFSWISGTLYINRIYYSDVNDQTTFSKYLNLYGSDQPTEIKALTQDDLIIFKQTSSIRIVDRQTSVSDFQPIVISSDDGSLGNNVALANGLIYGINHKGIFQFPVNGTFRYIHFPIKDEFDKITLDKMNLVYFAHNPINKSILMHYPNTGASRNTLCAEFNIIKDTWENISDIWESNVMIDAFDSDGTPVMLLGQEDGYLKNIGGDDDEGSNFTGRIDTGALFYTEPNTLRVRKKKLLTIQPVTNYEGSYT